MAETFFKYDYTTIVYIIELCKIGDGTYKLKMLLNMLIHDI